MEIQPRKGANEIWYEHEIVNAFRLAQTMYILKIKFLFKMCKNLIARYNAAIKPQ